MEQNKAANKAEMIRMTVAEIKKLPVEMQHEIKGAINVLKLQKANRKKTRPHKSNQP